MTGPQRSLGGRRFMIMQFQVTASRTCNGIHSVNAFVKNNIAEYLWENRCVLSLHMQDWPSVRMNTKLR